MPSAFINHQTHIMKKKRITYGVYGMMEYESVVKIGKARMKVRFTDGSMTSYGQNPALYTTSDFLVQHAIANSSDFKRGLIKVVRAIDLDEDVHIERNPEKASAEAGTSDGGVVTQGVAGTSDGGVVTQGVAGTSDGGVVTQGVAGTSDGGVVTQGVAGPSDGGVVTQGVAMAEDPEASAVAGSEGSAPDVKTEVEFTTNQEAKDYLQNTFGLKSAPKTRAEIISVGEKYGVTITFAN